MRTAPMQAPFGATVCPVRTEADAEAYTAWLASVGTVAVDTETTGLDVFSPGWSLRLVQIGDGDTAWVFEVGSEFDPLWKATLDSGRALIFHHATYDLLALRRLDLYPSTFDTKTLAHLVDPAGQHSLKKLCVELLGADASEGDEKLMAHFRSNGWKKGEGFAKVDLRHPDYVLYSGLDVVLTFRLFQKLRPLVVDSGQAHLVDFERRVSHLMATLTERGMSVDKSYAYQLGCTYDARREAAFDQCVIMGVDNPMSTKQVREALKAEGVTFTKKTAKGDYSVDEEALSLIDHPLAAAVLGVRRAGKFRKSYVEGTLAVLGADGRSHPWINPLAARTGRMAVSRPPLQQLPSSDADVRTMFVADPGHLIGASDYSNVELRVLAALADERVMKQAFLDGSDLHQMTADAAGVDRKLGKMANFLTVYGGGPQALAAQAKVDLRTADKVMSAFKRTYPGVDRWGKKLQMQAQASRYQLRTASGRRLPLDRDRIYAATNYVVQSTARDVLAQALLRLDEAGLFGHLLMVVHDECVWQAPAADAEDVAQSFKEIMSFSDFHGLPLPVDSEVYGASWGAGYQQSTRPEEAA